MSTTLQLRGRIQISDDSRYVFNHPLDFHFIADSLAGWPKLHVQVFKLDAAGRVERFCCRWKESHKATAGPGEHQAHKKPNTKDRGLRFQCSAEHAGPHGAHMPHMEAAEALHHR